MEIMDTTLRDGEQTVGLSFSPEEKLEIAKMLLQVGVDRIEVASARVSEGEMEAVKKIGAWADKNGVLDRLEVLGFVDGGMSLDWIKQSGLKVMNLLCKGSKRHLEVQLKKTKEEHVVDIKNILGQVNKIDIKVNIYIEDWSNGIQNSPDYVFYLIESLKDNGVVRWMLPDTLGVLSPEMTMKYVRIMVKRFPKLHFDFHAHNDYGMAVANTLSAIKAGVMGVHTTVNGLGERTGNAELANIAGVIKDFSNKDIKIKEEKLYWLSKLVESISSVRVAKNMPIMGENVFTQTCGVHADGDKKGGLYYNKLLPKRFNRNRTYALGKTSGKANIVQNLNILGISLNNEQIAKVTKKVVELGDQKELVTIEDLPFIIADVLGKQKKDSVELLDYLLSHKLGKKPEAVLKIRIKNEIYESKASGDGQYDAFMKALGKIYKKREKILPKLIDYTANIPAGGKTDALVETVITWNNGEEFRTRGLDCDQILAAIKATIKMLNLIEINFSNI